MRKVQILGTGCSKCRKLAENVEQAVADAGIEVEVEKVKDVKEIMKFNILMTPGLVIDGELKAAGRVPLPDEVKRLLLG